MADEQDRTDLGAFADAGAADREQRPEKRPRGRPKGSLNRKTEAFAEWYRESGLKDPLVAMAQFLTVDPVELQSWIIEHERAQKALGKRIALAVPSLFDIVKEMHAVASQLAPYLHGKKPTEIAITDERLPWLHIDLGTNQVAEGREIAGRKTLSIGQPLASKIKDLEDPDA